MTATKQEMDTICNAIAEDLAQLRQQTWIDATPTWSGVLPAILLMLTDDDNPANQAIARGEIERMARAADAYVNVQREQAAK